jgi:hypothetical protein
VGRAFILLSPEISFAVWGVHSRFILWRQILQTDQAAVIIGVELSKECFLTV